MKYRRAATWCLAGAVVASLCIAVSSATPALADTGTLTPAELATQANVEALLSGLQTTVGNVNANPTTAAGLAAAGTDPTPEIASAEQVVSVLTGPQLDALQTALNADPSWQQMPSQLDAAVGSVATPSSSAPSPLDFSGTFTDDCDSFGGAPGDFTATLIANEAQSAAQAAMLAAPGVVAVFIGVDAPTGIKIALAVIWGVADAVYLALAQVLAIALDCAQTAFTDTQVSTLPVDPGGSGMNVPGSSEISVQNLINSAQSTSAQITSVLGDVNTVNSQSDALITASTNLDNTLSTINTDVTEAQGDLKTLQTNVAILENTEVTVLQKADTEIANLNAFQALQVQMKIEENLSRNGIGTGPVGLFELPASAGGYLQTVQAIVTNEVTQQAALNSKGSAQAQSALATANADLAAGHYKAAYTYYSRAYQDAI